MLMLVEEAVHNPNTRQTGYTAVDRAQHSYPGAKFVVFPSSHSSGARATRHTLEFSVTLSDTQRVNLITRAVKELTDYINSLQSTGVDAVVMGGVFSYLMCQDTEPTTEEILAIRALLPKDTMVEVVGDIVSQLDELPRDNTRSDVLFEVAKHGRMLKWLSEEGNYALWEARMKKVNLLLNPTE